MSETEATERLALWLRAWEEGKPAADLGRPSDLYPLADGIRTVLAENVELRAENERLRRERKDVARIEARLEAVEVIHAENEQLLIKVGPKLRELGARLDAVRRLCDEIREPDSALTQAGRGGWRLGWGQMQDAVRAVLDSPPSGPEVSG